MCSLGMPTWPRVEETKYPFRHPLIGRLAHHMLSSRDKVSACRGVACEGIDRCGQRAWVIGRDQHRRVVRECSDGREVRHHDRVSGRHVFGQLVGQVVVGECVVLARVVGDENSAASW